jgi:parallel beta-helix repeat protein
VFKRNHTFTASVFICRLCSVIGLLLLVQQSWADTAEIYPGDSIAVAVSSLSPGDTLIVHQGTYNEDGRITFNVAGTQALPVLVTGAANEAKPLINGTNPNHNVMVVEGNVSYLTIRGLEITGTGDGINLNGNIHHVTLEDNHVHDVTGVGLNFRSSMNNLLVRRNHIHDTHDTAEGMYIGCNNSACRVTDSIFEKNLVHDTGSSADDSQGDGIELKQGSYNNIIRDNVIFNTRWPCILLYGTDGNPQNIVEGNVVWNCGDSAMQIQGEAIVRNNILINTSGAGEGFVSMNHQSSVTNLQVVNNTIIGASGAQCMVLRSWSDKPNMVVANNALYCEGNSALDFVNGSSGVTVANNVVVGSVSGAGGGTIQGRGTAQDFIGASAFNVWPSADSPLRGAANSTLTPTDDFNKSSRISPSDVGAYEADSSASNPGWAVQEAFKQLGPGDFTAPAPPTNLTVD